MSLALSRYSDEDAEDSIVAGREGIARRLPQDLTGATVEQRVKHHRVLAASYLEVALAQYKLEARPDEVAAGLRAAADWTARSLALEPSEVWSLRLHDFGLITAFGTSAQRVACATLPDACVEPTSEGDYGPRVARAWLAVLRGETVELAPPVQSDDWTREWAWGIAQGLSGLQGDLRALEHGLRDVLRFTERQALRGDWDVLEEGLMSMPAMGLCKLARERGLAVDLQSPYCPLSLLA
jgi:hypothetical protein